MLSPEEEFALTGASRASPGSEGYDDRRGAGGDPARWRVDARSTQPGDPWIGTERTPHHGPGAAGRAAAAPSSVSERGGGDERQGMLDAAELEELARARRDRHGALHVHRPAGPLHGQARPAGFFLEEILGEEGLHACLYLLAIDMEMEPLPGYEYASWETGYGDFRMIPDMATLRWCPWLEKTAMVICDINDEEDGRAGRGRAAADPEAADRSGGRGRLHGEDRIGAGVLPVQGLVRRHRRAGGYRDARGRARPYIMDYHMLQTTKDEWIIRQIRNDMRGAGIPVEFSKGEFGKGQHEINITYSDASSNADHHALYKHGVKEIARAERRRGHLHGEVDDGRGGVVVPPALERLERRRRTSPSCATTTAAHHMTETFRWYLGGLMATAREMAWMYAPFVNSYKRYQLGSWAPTAIVWSRDNRTCGFRTVGEHTGSRVECRHPRRRREPVPRVRRDDRERDVGHREQDGAARDVRGQRLRGEGRAARARRRCTRRSRCSASSRSRARRSATSSSSTC